VSLEESHPTLPREKRNSSAEVIRKLLCVLLCGMKTIWQTVKAAWERRKMGTFAVVVGGLLE